MNQFLTLLKLEFTSSSTRVKDGVSVYSRVKKYLLTTLGVGLIVLLILYALNSILDVCLEANLKQEFIVYYVFIVQIVQVLFGLSLTTKTLYFKTDSNILKLPVSGKMLFLAKISYLFIYEFLFNTVLTLPVFILFGVKTGASAIFYVMLLPNIIFLPMIPFLIALLLSVPAMYLSSFLKNKFIVMLIMYIVFLSLGFLIYIYALKFILNILNSVNISDVFTDTTIYNIKQFANYLVFPLLFKNSLLNYRLLPSMAINFSIVLLLGGLILLFADKIYLKIILSNSERDIKAYNNNAQIKDRSINGALFFREFTTIFRSTNYAFQYLTVVITTPLMVYFSSEIASSIGVSLIGEGVLPGIVVLVLIMFLSMGTSFAATSITREGDNFFHTKTIPVSYTRQVTIKFLMYLIVSIPSIFISCLVLAIAGFLSYPAALLIALAVSLIVIGNIAAAIFMDIKKPQFIYLEGNEVTTSTKNINSSISIGFIIAVVMGILSIALSYFVSIPSMYLALFGFAIPFAIYEICRLFIKLESRYKRIEA